MFGSSDKSSNSSSLFGSSDSSSTTSSSVMPQAMKNLIPGFEEDPVCAQCCPDLTIKQRVIGFFACAGLGWILSFVGTLTLVGGMTTENVRTFAVLYVVGNIIALCATGFFLGPRSQCRKMWDPTRRFTTAFYLIMLIVVFVVAILKQNVWLVLFLLLIEIMAAAWYGLSYIPFGRKIFCGCLRQTQMCSPCFYVYDSMADATKQATASTSSSSSSSSATLFGGQKSSGSGSFFGKK